MLIDRSHDQVPNEFDGIPIVASDGNPDFALAFSHGEAFNNDSIALIGTVDTVLVLNLVLNANLLQRKRALNLTS